MKTNKIFWELVSQNLYNNPEDLGFDFEPEMSPEEKFKLQVEESQSGILTCSDLELLWFYLR